MSENVEKQLWVVLQWVCRADVVKRVGVEALRGDWKALKEGRDFAWVCGIQTGASSQ
jgi:hypothetical protein